MLARREFLLSAASALVPVNRCAGSVLFSAPESPLAGESLRGYQRCFDFEVSQTMPEDVRLMIVPGFRTLSQAQWEALPGIVHDGACLILESGLAFASPGEINHQRAGLVKYFGINISPHLFGGARGEFRYIRYHWPIEVLVRDFSESVTIEAHSGEAIATANGHVLAIRRRLGRGSVIYLGSPLGPMLWFGDAQAEAWVRSIATRYIKPLN